MYGDEELQKHWLFKHAHSDYEKNFLYENYVL